MNAEATGVDEVTQTGIRGGSESVKASTLTLAHLAILFEANQSLLAEPLNFYDYRLGVYPLWWHAYYSFFYTHTHTLFIFN